MATATAAPATTIGTDLVRDKQTVRGFYKEIYDKENKFEGFKFAAKAETADGENWKTLEKEGWKAFNSNTVVGYTVKSQAAFELLVPDAEQRIVLSQAGINYYQSTKQNALCIKVKEGTGVVAADGTLIPPEPENNDEELDMKEILNTPPQRRSMSPMEKAQKQLAVLQGILPAEDLKRMLLELAATMSQQPQIVEEQQSA